MLCAGILPQERAESTEVLCRCSAVDVADVMKEAEGPDMRLPEYVRCGEDAHTAEAHRQGALHMTLLEHPQALADRYNVEGTETAGHKAARRSEQLLQLFLYLHVLAAEQPGRAIGIAVSKSHEAMQWAFQKLLAPQTVM